MDVGRGSGRIKTEGVSLQCRPCFDGPNLRGSRMTSSKRPSTNEVAAGSRDVDRPMGSSAFVPALTVPWHKRALLGTKDE